jgi:hypothetical protein
VEDSESSRRTLIVMVVLDSTVEELYFCSCFCREVIIA